MCGRYTLSRTEEVRERFGIETDGFELRPRFNVCPEQIMPVVTGGADGRRLNLMQWGLVPFWSKEAKSIAINARMEGILSKPSFRKPIRYGRCLIPACGFYEWKKEPGGKVPHHIRRKDGALFAFAGIYDTWQNADTSELRSFAIVTTAPSVLLAQIHNRMPVMLTPEQEEMWLATEPGKADALLSALELLPDSALQIYPVSRLVNFGKNDFPVLIQREQ